MPKLDVLEDEVDISTASVLFLKFADANGYEDFYGLLVQNVEHERSTYKRLWFCSIESLGRSGMKALSKGEPTQTFFLI